MFGSFSGVCHPASVSRLSAIPARLLLLTHELHQQQWFKQFTKVCNPTLMWTYTTGVWRYETSENIVRLSVSWLCFFIALPFNTLRPRQDGRHFPDILKCIFLNENVWISLTISLKCVRKVRFNNIPSLVQIMAWRRPGDKPLSEPMSVFVPTHICVTRPQWVNSCL